MSPGGEIQRDKTVSLFNWYNAISHPRGETAHKQNFFACSLVGTTLTEAEHIPWGAEHCQHPMGTEVTPGAAVLELFPFFPSLPGEALSPVGRDAVSLLKLSLTKTSSLSQFRPWKCCVFFFFVLKNSKLRHLIWFTARKSWLRKPLRMAGCHIHTKLHSGNCQTNTEMASF